MSSTFSSDDVRVVGDVMIASLLAGGIRIVMTKAFIEPAAAWLGRAGWRWLDTASGDRLPDWFKTSKDDDGR